MFACLFSLFILDALTTGELMYLVTGHTDSFSGFCAKETMFFWGEGNKLDFFLSSVIGEVIFESKN